MRFFLWPRMWSALANDLCVFENNVNSICWVEWSINVLAQVGSVFSTSLLSFWLLVSIIKREIDISNYNYGFVCFFLQSYQLSPNVFWTSIFRSINIKDCEVFLTNLPFYNYKNDLVYYNIPGSDIYLNKIQPRQLSFSFLW